LAVTGKSGNISENTGDKICADRGGGAGSAAICRGCSRHEHTPDADWQFSDAGIRWFIHRYLLGQSLSYFQNEFAGRITTKVVQTALAVRKTVMKLLDVLNYVLIYFMGTLILAAAGCCIFSFPGYVLRRKCRLISAR